MFKQPLTVGELKEILAAFDDKTLIYTIEDGTGTLIPIVVRNYDLEAPYFLTFEQS